MLAKQLGNIEKTRMHQRLTARQGEVVDVECVDQAPNPRLSAAVSGPPMALPPSSRHSL